MKIDNRVLRVIFAGAAIAVMFFLLGQGKFKNISVEFQKSTARIETSENVPNASTVEKSGLFNEWKEWKKSFISDSPAKSNNQPASSVIVSQPACQERQREINKASGWFKLGPSDGRINAVQMVGNIMYIGSASGGIFRSADFGKSWEHYSQGLTSTAINRLNYIDNVLYAAVNDGLYKLEKQTWTKIFNSPTVDSQVLRVFKSVRTTKSKAMLWLLTAEALYTSSDGQSWQKNTTLTAGWYTSLLVSKTGEIYVSSFDDLYVSKDQGSTWDRIFNSVWEMAEDKNGNLYVTKFSDRQLYRKNFKSNIFSQLDAPNNNTMKMGTLAYFNDTLFIEGVNVFYWSTDGGKTFQSVTSQGYGYELPDKPAFWDIRQIAPQNSNRVILANDNGVAEIDLQTKNIHRYAPVLYFSEIHSLAVTKNENIMTSYWDHFAILSNDCAINWRGYFGGESARLIADPMSNDIFLTFEYHNFFAFDVHGNLLWNANPPQHVSEGTLDLGRTDTSFDGKTGRAYLVFDRSEYIDKETLTTLISPAKLVSLDLTTGSAPVNYKEVDLPMDIAFINALAVDPSNSGRILLIADGLVYESLDNATNWIKRVDLYRSIFRMAINPFNSKEALFAADGGNIILYQVGKDEKGGMPDSISYIILPGSDQNSQVFDVVYDPYKSGVVYAGSKNGFYISKDSGRTWRLFNNGLYASEIRQIVPLKDRVFIGVWGSGVAVINKNKLLK